MSKLFLPRDTAVAKKLVFVLTAAATVVTAMFAVLDPSSHPNTSAVASLAGPLTVLVLATGIVLLPAPAAWMWAGYPLAATITICVTDLATHDSSVTGQLFYFFPVLYAGAQLRRTAAFSICATAVAAEAVSVATSLPIHLAVIDTSFVAAALGTTTGILVYSGERVDLLITQLREQAAIDPLTGLVTRRVLDSAATSSLLSANSDGGTALIIVDIDHFKQINDVHGHPAGDLVLKRVADLLCANSRHTDITSRMGGDELAVLLPGCSLADVTRRAHVLLECIDNLRIDLSGVSMATGQTDVRAVRLTASIGLAHLPTHAQDVHDLYRSADASLYRAKRAGRNQVGQPLESV